MVEIFKRLFFINTQKVDETDDFATFFLYAKSGEKKAFFKKVIAGANQDQKKYLERYEKMISHQK